MRQEKCRHVRIRPVRRPLRRHLDGRPAAARARPASRDRGRLRGRRLARARPGRSAPARGLLLAARRAGRRGRGRRGARRTGRRGLHARPAGRDGRGGIPLRMAKPARMREPGHAARGAPTARHPRAGDARGHAYADGGDRFWLDDTTVAIGLGYRTNRAGAEALAAWSSPRAWRRDLRHAARPGARPGPAPAVVPVRPRPGLCVVYEPLAPVRLLQDLRERGIDWIAIDRDSYDAMGCNVLAVRPGVVVMVDGAPRAARARAAGRRGARLRRLGASLKGDGGPTCLTAPLLRGRLTLLADGQRQATARRGVRRGRGRRRS